MIGVLGASGVARGAAGIAGDFETACRRLKRRAPWQVAPLPHTQIARAGAAAGPVSASKQARRKRLALQVLALQMGHARPTSALR
jgi:hypothetical protein